MLFTPPLLLPILVLPLLLYTYTIIILTRRFIGLGIVFEYRHTGFLQLGVHFLTIINSGISSFHSYRSYSKRMPATFLSIILCFSSNPLLALLVRSSVIRHELPSSCLGRCLLILFLLLYCTLLCLHFEWIIYIFGITALVLAFPCL